MLLSGLYYMNQGLIRSISMEGFPGGSAVKESSCQSRRCRFDPWVRKKPWRRTWNPLQYSCLGNPMNRGA